MEVVNMILERFSAGRLAAIFKNYLVAVLLVKQLAFSLYFLPDYRPVEECAGNTGEEFVTAEMATSLNVAVLQLVKSLNCIETTVAGLLQTT